MKKNIALIWGGYSLEAEISAKSRDMLYRVFDHSKYNIYKVQITQDKWVVEIDGDEIDIDKNFFGFVFPITGLKISFDFAYITIHGTPGENGLLQGYLEMLGIPHSTCNVETSSLLFNKFFCNQFLRNFNINVAPSILLRETDEIDIDAIVEKINLPLFVKPNVGGSSFATTKVKAKEELKNAIELAFEQSPQVVIEGFIEGTEVTCGCFKIKNELIALPITEIVTLKEFFDYEAKYEGASEEITPARISEHLTNDVFSLTKQIYNLVGAKGIIRADFIISNGVPYLLEVNTTPGMTETSFLPQQIAAAGLSLTDVLSNIIEDNFAEIKLSSEL